MKKRQTDDERIDNELARTVSLLTLDVPFVCPPWLTAYAQFAGCEPQLRELLRLALLNEAQQNVMTALKSAVCVSGLEDYFATDSDVEPVLRETFRRVFDDRVLPHKTNSYVVLCPDDPELNETLRRCFEFIAHTCDAMDLRQLFLFLAVLAKLRMEPLTNPIAVAIHAALDRLADDKERLAALQLNPLAADDWERIPDQQAAVRREIYWTRSARRAQREQMAANEAKQRSATAAAASMADDDDDDT